MATTGFFTDSTLCIGCKACEVACKEWNDVPADGYVWTGHSYDNTGGLGHSTWRHVKFVEHLRDGAPAWDFSSDVCKHCENAGCLEACPTGSIIRTEFGGVYVQPDICNGCGYCVVACPFGVVDRRPHDGRAFKCTFCYDRQKAGLVPACAKACPTESIQFGDLDELRARAAARLVELQARGVEDAVVYDASGTSVGGTHAIFLVRGDVRTFNLPIQPQVPTVLLGQAWTSAALTAAAATAAIIAGLSGATLWSLVTALVATAVLGTFATFRPGVGFHYWTPAPEVESAAGPSYYHRPLLKPPVWTWEIPTYFFVGGAAGIAAAIAAIGVFGGGDRTLVTHALAVAAVGALLSPMLLISDLGRPSRFLNMLRVFKLQSPMSVGAWTLAVFSTSVFAALAGAGVLGSTSIFETCTIAAGLSGLLLATYTGVLIGATAVPVWARYVRLLPIQFGASAMGAAVSLIELTGHWPASINRIAIAAAAIETVTGVVLEVQHDRITRTLFSGSAGVVTRLGDILSGPLPLAIRTLAAASLPFRLVAAIASIVGSLCTRFGWIAVGRGSTADPTLALGEPARHTDAVTH